MSEIQLQHSIAKAATAIFKSLPREGRQVLGNPITGNPDELITLNSMDKNECTLVHRFAEGCYIREIVMPASSIVVGKVHKTEHFNIILEGSVTVITSEGANRYDAPCTFISKAGVQKVVIMHTECRWQTVHATTETDIPTIEQNLAEDTYDEYEACRLLDKAQEVLT